MDGRDRLVPLSDLKSQLAPVYLSYSGDTSAALSIREEEKPSEFANWFLTHLSRGAASVASSSGARLMSKISRRDFVQSLGAFDMMPLAVHTWGCACARLPF